MVRPGGFEPPARGLGNPCSIHLSYGRMCPFLNETITGPRDDATDPAASSRQGGAPPSPALSHIHRYGSVV